LCCTRRSAEAFYRGAFKTSFALHRIDNRYSFGNDLVNGAAGSDTLRGDGGNDFLLGGTGNNLLLGGTGSDLLVGGQGADTLIGGGGKDYFRYSSFVDGNDVIRDFAVAADVIDLVPLLSRTQFSGNTALQKFQSFVTLTQVGANTQVSINSAGSGAPPTNVLLATLEGVTANALTASNFAIL
jgi:Ca2+-binding RTX toxin-like protein